VDVIILVVTTVLALITILLVIWVAEEQMFIFGLRPSESISTDIAGLITLSRGLPGDVELSYGSITKDVLYNITIKNKLVCVTARAHYTSTDCSSFSAPDDVDGGEKVDVSDFNVLIKKTDGGVVTVNFEELED